MNHLKTMNRKITFEYLGVYNGKNELIDAREITVEYYTEDNRIYIEGIDYKGKDITDLVNHEKIYSHLGEVIYQETNN